MCIIIQNDDSYKLSIIQTKYILYCLNVILQILQEIESKHGSSEFNMKKFIGFLYDQPFPEPGSTVHIPEESSSHSAE